MNIFKKVLGLALAVNMISMNAVQENPVLMPALFATASWVTLATGKYFGTECLKPKSSLGFVLLGLGTFVGMDALLNSGEPIKNLYNRFSQICEQVTYRSGARLIGAVGCLAIMCSAVMNNDIGSPLTMIKNLATAGFKTTAQDLVQKAGAALIPS